MPSIRRPRSIDQPRAPEGDDRRFLPRYEPAVGLVHLAWRDQEFVACPGRLVDIAVGGAAVLAAETPPAGARVFLMLADEQLPTEVVRALVLEASPLGVGACLVRLRFEAPCPPALFEAATCGFDALRALLN